MNRPNPKYFLNLGSTVSFPEILKWDLHFPRAKHRYVSAYVDTDLPKKGGKTEGSRLSRGTPQSWVIHLWSRLDLRLAVSKCADFRIRFSKYDCDQGHSTKSQGYD